MLYIQIISWDVVQRKGLVQEFSKCIYMYQYMWKSIHFYVYLKNLYYINSLSTTKWQMQVISSKESILVGIFP